MKKHKIWNMLLMILPLIAVLLTNQPNCVAMKFAAPHPEQNYIEYCSGFSLLPVGYGNWGPMLTGIVSLALEFLGVLHYHGSNVRKWMKGISVAAVLLSLVSLIFGSMTAISWCISAVLLINTVLVYTSNK
ncbi:MAG: hypothetical protein IKJ99_09270 [Oscillospiraceae bacterium]|nr:hypothetical protein [Oscillospiraceae bacterium]